MGAKLAAVCVLLALLGEVKGHGRLMEPPGRASMWRFGYGTPINYNDNQLYCGGFNNQWGVHRGRCGVCGDPWQGPREHEAGGKYATGRVVRRYLAGQTFSVAVEITANHLGFFEFKLCPNDDAKKAVTQACLDKHVLDLGDVEGTRYFIGPDTGTYHVKVKLPADVTCSQCMLQWRYHTGNSYGVGEDGRGCKGCGPQEEFYGCADIAIEAGPPGETEGPPGSLPPPTKTPSHPRPASTAKYPWFQLLSTKKSHWFQPITTEKPNWFQPITTKKPNWFQPITTEKPNWFQPITTKKPNWFQPITTEKPIWWQPITTKKPAVYQPIKPLVPIGFRPLQGAASGGGCRGINTWSGDPKLDWWCSVNCARSFCPPTMCRCE